MPCKPLSSHNLDELKRRLHEAFVPSLLHKNYQANWSQDNPTFGMCAVASEVAWFVLGGAPKGWVAYVTQDPLMGGTHWWLEHTSGLRFDPTAEQYTTQGLRPPYERGLLGRPAGFMGIRVDQGNVWGFDRKPSKRAQQLIDRMMTLSPKDPTRQTPTKKKAP